MKKAFILQAVAISAGLTTGYLVNAAGIHQKVTRQAVYSAQPSTLAEPIKAVPENITAQLPNTTETVQKTKKALTTREIESELAALAGVLYERADRDRKAELYRAWFEQDSVSAFQNLIDADTQSLSFNPLINEALSALTVDNTRQAGEIISELEPTFYRESLVKSFVSKSLALNKAQANEWLQNLADPDIRKIAFNQATDTIATTAPNDFIDFVTNNIADIEVEKANAVSKLVGVELTVPNDPALLRNQLTQLEQLPDTIKYGITEGFISKLGSSNPTEAENWIKDSPASLQRDVALNAFLLSKPTQSSKGLELLDLYQEGPERDIALNIVMADLYYEAAARGENGLQQVQAKLSSISGFDESTKKALYNQLSEVDQERRAEQAELNQNPVG